MYYIFLEFILVPQIKLNLYVLDRMNDTLYTSCHHNRNVLVYYFYYYIIFLYSYVGF